MTSAEDLIMKECVRLASEATARAKAKANEIVTTAARRAISQGSILTRKKAIARARDSNENVTTAEKQVILHESTRKAREEESQRKTRLQRERRRGMVLGARMGESSSLD